MCSTLAFLLNSCKLSNSLFFPICKYVFDCGNAEASILCQAIVAAVFGSLGS